MRISVYLAAASLFAASPVAAGMVVDQSNLWTVSPEKEAASSGFIITNPELYAWQAQSVTAGLSGKLKRVDLQIFRAIAPVTLTIFSGHPSSGGVALGAVEISAADIPFDNPVGLEFVEIDVSGLNLSFDAGDIFSLQVSVGYDYSETLKRVRWLFGEFTGEVDEEGNQIVVGLNYADGVNMIYDSINGTWQASSFDRGFRTWVETPEPGALGLLGIGLLGMAGLRRRKAA